MDKHSWISPIPYSMVTGDSWCLILGGKGLFGEISHQWEFQDPKLEVPTIYKAYFSGLCKGISLQNMALYGTVPPF